MGKPFVGLPSVSQPDSGSAFLHMDSTRFRSGTQACFGWGCTVHRQAWGACTSYKLLTGSVCGISGVHGDSQCLCVCELCEDNVYRFCGVAGTEELLDPAVSHADAPNLRERFYEVQQLLFG